MFEFLMCKYVFTFTGSNPSLVTQAPGECKDTIPNCAEYDLTSVCTDTQYTQWAQTNCRLSCNMCSEYYNTFIY